MSHPEPTPTELENVLDTSLDTTSLQAHIDASAFEVEEIKDADSSISDDKLKQIHLYLSAWYATGQDPRTSSQSAETRSVSFARDDSADYFALASRLDPTGTVASNAKPSATLSVPDVKGLE
jgi:hypothetical protein